MKTTISKYGAALLMLLLLNAINNKTMGQSNRLDSDRTEKKATTKNRQVVNSFYAAIEAQKFEVIKDIFWENAKQLIPYAPEGFPKLLDGSEAIYKQFSGLTAYFGQIKFSRQIFATEDPNLFFVKFQGDMEVKGGGKYENDYIGTFRLKDGKIMEYTEYFDPIVMAKAFGLKIN